MAAEQFIPDSEVQALEDAKKEKTHFEEFKYYYIIGVPVTIIVFWLIYKFA